MLKQPFSYLLKLFVIIISLLFIYLFIQIIYFILNNYFTSISEVGYLFTPSIFPNYLNNGKNFYKGTPEKVYTNFLADRPKIREELSGIGGVYSFLNNLNGDSYLGSAQNIYDRMVFYYSESARGAVKNSYICSALTFYGLSNFTLRILFLCAKGIDPRIKEQEFLDNFEWPYNISKDAVAPMAGRKDEPISFAHVSKAVICLNVKTGEINEYP